jgi:hypothetical protein
MVGEFALKPRRLSAPQSTRVAGSAFPPGPDPRIAPCTPVTHDPIEQGLLETNVMPKLLAFDPLVAQYFLPFGQKFPIKGGIANEAGILAVGGSHDAKLLQ